MAPFETVTVTDNYYAILDVSPDADEDAIRSSYRRLARLRHPDKNPDDPNATAHFQAVSPCCAHSLMWASDSVSSTDALYLVANCILYPGRPSQPRSVRLVAEKPS